MSIITNAFLVCVLCVALYSADDFHFGSQANSQLGYQETVKLSSIPLKSRTKNVYYNSNNTKIIKVSLLFSFLQSLYLCNLPLILHRTLWYGAFIQVTEVHETYEYRRRIDCFTELN